MNMPKLFPMPAPSVAFELRRMGMAVSALALLVVFLIVMTTALFLTRDQARTQLALLTEQMALGCQAALAFGDRSASEQLLNSLASDPQIVTASLRDTQHREAAVYLRNHATRGVLLPSILSRHDVIEVTRQVKFDDQVLGSVTVQAENQRAWQLFMGLLLAMLLSLMVALFSAWKTAGWLSLCITAPLRRLQVTTRAMREQRNFHLRAPVERLAELRELGEDFNSLVREVEHNEKEAKHQKRILEEKNASLSHMAFFDVVTGLPNRSLFFDRLQQAVRHCQANPGHRLVVLFIDLDNFKLVNDYFGHAVGDKVLNDVGASLLALSTSVDTVSRFGGDEFAVMMRRDPSTSDIDEAVDQILKAIKRKVVGDGKNGEVVISASIGVVCFPDDTTSETRLLRLADKAMYQAKSRGGDQTFFVGKHSRIGEKDENE